MPGQAALAFMDYSDAGVGCGHPGPVPQALFDLQAFFVKLHGLAVPTLEFVDDADVVQCVGLVFFLIVPAK